MCLYRDGTFEVPCVDWKNVLGFIFPVGAACVSAANMFCFQPIMHFPVMHFPVMHFSELTMP